MERIGIFGGTFDPIHIGHLVAGVNAKHALQLDRVLFVVANQPWQKSDRAVTAAEQRLALVEAAVEDAPGLEASRLEIDRGGDSYTADTLEALAEGPDRDLFLVIGADVAAELDTWERIDVVRNLATLVVVNRPGTAVPDVGPGWRVQAVEIPQLEISSSDLRARAADGRPLDHVVPRAVINRIRELGLYAGGR
ncbi:MAG TPA: nicotinate-nucleotide adenylyltransferase [Acidimicrobiales bacterium]|nr:nicotinate-nucleotide adenylyltransferase [Acidimicrobiales bacterium]